MPVIASFYVIHRVVSRHPAEKVLEFYTKCFACSSQEGWDVLRSSYFIPSSKNPMNQWTTLSILYLRLWLGLKWTSYLR